MTYGVILAGGRGERFWPLSRAERPKQLLRLISDKTMLQETIDRILPLIPVERIVVVTSEDMIDLILKEIPILKPENILAEPMGRNTCLAIGLAAEHLRRQDPRAVMAVLSADHIIKPAERLHDLIKVGADIAAADDKLITIGIDPTRPDTAYGYIKLSQLYKSVNNIQVFEVDSFTEKPKPAVAQEYYYGRKHLWNSGMFIWSVETIINAINQCQVDIGRALDEYAGHIDQSDELACRRKLYEESDGISIDFAVLENAGNVVTIKGDIIWDDVGSWNSLERYKERDQENNVIVGQVRAIDSFENTIYNDSNGLVISLGVSDLVVVKTDDIVLVAHKTKVNEVKQLLAEMNGDDKMKVYL
ncbi:MAG: mannose-1-phosphate guanylyltransferase [candidate division Zixibacteria bacterium]|nr:mannose-1-phosphate guanylyltransferase [candidate division Zixibacteria bacterium]